MGPLAAALLMVAWPPVQEVSELSPSPEYYRLAKPIVGVGVRASGKEVPLRTSVSRRSFRLIQPQGRAQ